MPQKPSSIAPWAQKQLLFELAVSPKGLILYAYLIVFYHFTQFYDYDISKSIQNQCKLKLMKIHSEHPAS